LDRGLLISDKLDIITSAEISVFSHATEDAGKVELAVFNLFPEASGLRTKIHRLKGHHNDPLIRMIMKITESEKAGRLLLNVIRGFSNEDRWRLLDEAEERTDEAGWFYMRLDKQMAYQGKAVLHDADSIRIRFRFKIPHGSNSTCFVQKHIAEVINEMESDGTSGL